MRYGGPTGGHGGAEIGGEEGSIVRVIQGEILELT